MGSIEFDALSMIKEEFGLDKSELDEFLRKYINDYSFKNSEFSL